MVSIIIPAYNAEEFIDRCLQSVMNQTYKNLQIIVINDGSTDQTLEKIRQYEMLDERFKIIDQDNLGVAETRNVGLENADGDFVLFIDSDDWIELNAVETLLAKMSDEVDIVFCKYDKAETDEQVSHVDEIIFETWDNERQLYEFLTHKRMTGMLWNKLIRKSIIRDVKFDSTVGYGEDAQFLWRILKYSRTMFVTNEILYHHVMENSSISHLSFSDKKYSAIPMWEGICENVFATVPKYSSLAIERLLAQSIFSLYEIKESSYNNRENINHMKSIIRKNLRFLLKAKTISNKMKLYGIYAML